MEESEKVSQDDVNEFLDALRESGVTNMYGARPYIMEEYPELSKQEAGEMLSIWMKTYSERHPHD